MIIYIIIGFVIVVFVGWLIYSIRTDKTLDRLEKTVEMLDKECKIIEEEISRLEEKR